MSRMNRRTFLKSAAVAAGGIATGVVHAGVWSRPASASEAVRVYLVVVDGLRPDELHLMPTLTSLAEDGTFYPEGRAEMVAETTPNHVSMLTGMLGARHGMPGNSVPGRMGFNPRVGDNPRYLKADTLFTLASRQAPDLVTASVTSKEYLVHMSLHDRDADGEPDAGVVYEPRFYIPESDHEPDVLVMEGALDIVREHDPDFCFINLGDVDRVGHVDVTGGGTQGDLALWRMQTLTDTDALLRVLVEQLQDLGVWEQTVLIVSPDHNMDWSRVHDIVSLMPAFEDDELLAGEVVVGQNGGAALYALRSPEDPQADARLARMREIALATDGVEEAYYIRPNPADGGDAHWVGRVHPEWGLVGDRTGDLVMSVAPGWRVTEPGPTGNPIPGNHGHAVTLPIPIVVSGGWEGIREQTVEAPDGLGQSDYHPSQARNIDMAPTVAWLLGLNPPPGGFDGRVLDEAFSDRPATRVDVADIASLPRLERVAGETRLETAVAISERAWPDGADAVVIAAARDFPDALAGTTLAVANNAPLLLADRGGLSPAVADEIRRLEPSTAFVLGGQAALSEQVVTDLTEAGIDESDIHRIGGENRFDTARLIAEEVGAADGEAVLVVGQRPDAPAFADALAAGPIAAAAGRPILLTLADRLPDETKAALEATEVTRLLIAGGTAVVSQRLEDELRGDGLVVERLGGPDRYETSRLLAERGVREGALTDEVWLASGADFADALGSAAAVARPGQTGGGIQEAVGTLLLVHPTRLDASDGARRFLHDRADELVRLVLVGGTSALSADLADDVGRLVMERRTRPTR